MNKLKRMLAIPFTMLQTVAAILMTLTITFLIVVSVIAVSTTLVLWTAHILHYLF